MTEPVKIMTFGGAKFDKNQVESSNTVKKNGRTYYVVNFKTGAQVQYPAQAKDNNASIDIGRGEAANTVGSVSEGAGMAQLYDKVNKGKSGYKDLKTGEGIITQKADKYIISQFWGLEFTGSKKPDNVILKGCTSCKVDTRGGNSLARDEVTLERSGKFVSQHNEVIMDAKDRTDEVNGITITNSSMGAGIHHEGDNRDKLK